MRTGHALSLDCPSHTEGIHHVQLPVQDTQTMLATNMDGRCIFQHEDCDTLLSWQRACAGRGTCGVAGVDNVHELGRFGTLELTLQPVQIWVPGVWMAGAIS